MQPRSRANVYARLVTCLFVINRADTPLSITTKAPSAGLCFGGGGLAYIGLLRPFDGLAVDEDRDTGRDGFGDPERMPDARGAKQAA